MNGTVKLIIEIDKRAYEACKKLSTKNDGGLVAPCAINSIANGMVFDNNSEKADYTYCPNCGAKMEG